MRFRAIALSTWIAIVAVGYGLSQTAFDTCASGGSFELLALCIYTPEYTNIWTPLWAGDPFIRRSLVFIAIALVAVGYTVADPVVDLFATARRRAGDALAGIRTGWRF